MSVKERKKGKSVWALLFGFSEEFEDTKNVLSDEAYNKELKEALAKIEKMEKRFDVPDKVKKDKKNQAKQHIVKEPLNQVKKEKDSQKEDQEKERE